MLTLSRPTRQGTTGFSMQLIGANPKSRIVPEGQLASRVNYLRGRRSANWHTHVATYRSVRYSDIYPGVDLLFYGEPGRLEYDFVVRPGTKPTTPKLRFAGTRRVHLNKAGELCLELPGGEVRWHPPIAYQERKGRRSPVACRYVLKGRQEVGFQVGSYDKSRPLILDPVLVYASYLGGSRTTCGYGIATDGYGNLYMTGETTSTDLPILDPLQNEYRGGKEIFVTHLNTQRSGASSLISATYLGGSGDETGFAIALGGKADVFITGKTNSPDFPVTFNALQPGIGGVPEQGTGRYPDNAFLIRLGAQGTTLLYATYLGGSEDTVGYAIAADVSGCAYVTGMTQSPDFPTSRGALQPQFGSGDRKAFVTKIDTNLTGPSALIYSTFLGGEESENGRGIALDRAGNAYITGDTNSTQFPTTENAFQRAYDAGSSQGAGNGDAFVSILNASGSALLYSTLLGGSGSDAGRGIALDGAGNIYITGVTNSGTPDSMPNLSSRPFPTTPGAFQSGASLPLAYHYGFVARLDPTKSGRASLIYSTYLTHAVVQRTQDTTTEANAIAVDGQGNAYITGETHLPSVPGLPYTLETFQAQSGGGETDAFLLKLDSTGSTLLYGTYLGGNDFDRGNGIAIDSDGNTYLTGETGAMNFPTTDTTEGSLLAYQSVATGLADAFVARIRTVDPAANAWATLVFQSDTFRMIGFWAMNGSKHVSVSMAAGKNAIPAPNYRLAGMGDTQGDGQLDLAFQNDATGQVMLWFMQGTQIASTGMVSLPPLPGQRLVAVGDFNRDGKADLVFFHQKTGQISVWMMNGARVQRVFPITAERLLKPNLPTGWKPVGVGDFNGDGKLDLVIQNSQTGAIAFYLLNGTKLTKVALLSEPRPLPTWKVCGTADFDGDGSPDLLMQNALTDELVIWYMQGVKVMRKVPISQAPASKYRLIGVR